MKLQRPTPEEKRALKGDTNVEALIYALDRRLEEPRAVIIVGRASYQLGNDVFAGKLRELLGEEHKVNELTRKRFLTEDLDICHTDAAQEIVDAAHEHSYLAEMADCYVHALNQQTLVLPIGWRDRLQDVPLALEKLQLKRLDPLDFIMCKGAAGRPKDIKFLRAFCAALSIDQAQIQAKVDETLKHKSAKLFLDTSAQAFLKMLPAKLFPPPQKPQPGLD
jgi:hypothetical protein